MGRHSLEDPERVPAAGGAGRALDGARVLVTRSPDRAATLTAALRQAGAEPLLLPLIDFERAPDQHSLDVVFDALGAGAYDWLVISSITTISALSEKAAERGLTLKQWIPESLRIAGIGPSSLGALAAEGISVHLAPEQFHSAAGLVAVWPRGARRVLLPQADIAAPALAEGLESQGAIVQTVTAYATVDYPANPARRLNAKLSAPAPAYSNPDFIAVLQLEEAKAQLKAGRLHAVVAASPSAVRRIHAALSPLGDCRLVAIGRSTADEAAAQGLYVASVASEPTPEGLVAAVLEALLPGIPSPNSSHQVKDRT